MAYERKDESGSGSGSAKADPSDVGPCIAPGGCGFDVGPCIAPGGCGSNVGPCFAPGGGGSAAAIRSKGCGGVSGCAALAAPYRRKSLRNPNINYRSGWWAITIQVAKNKSILGAIVGDNVALNALGKAVDAYWRALPAKYPELELFDFVVMPNHFHALIRIHSAPTNHDHHLGFLMSRFKGGTSFLYGKMRRAGEIEDIGESLWQRDYWDDLISGNEEFAGWQKYILANPANWSSDRYGACTAYTFGNTELLNKPRIAFVASQGFYASELRPRKIWSESGSGSGSESGSAKADPSDVGPCFALGGGGSAAAAMCSEGKVGVSGCAASAAPCCGSEPAAIRPKGCGGVSGCAALAAPEENVLISTFTSAQEREALLRALDKRRPLIAVFPAGIPIECELIPELATAIREGWALAVSPQAPGSRLNKKIATWCNEFLLKNAEEIWVGNISPNGMLAQMLASLGKF